MIRQERKYLHRLKNELELIKNNLDSRVVLERSIPMNKIKTERMRNKYLLNLDYQEAVIQQKTNEV